MKLISDILQQDIYQEYLLCKRLERNDIFNNLLEPINRTTTAFEKYNYS